ncbi:hypothetical protein TanjilG_28368 [Lupinus angustifolius]|uniref:Phosphoribulokinase/uridine kinase domain-containing protein n=1 Tax=Lupinus angustifolius TaxID=3871 RepID=A0A4P1RJ44_LUPAN|nr:hypothetical protein TanjilG_28368 [Lupinus angustifolius]
MEVTMLCSAASPLSTIRNTQNKYDYPSLSFTSILLNHRNRSSFSFPTFKPLHLSQFNINHRFKVLSAQNEQFHVLQPSGVDELYDALVSRLLHSPSISSSSNFKHLVALAGPPGAGKSTVANEVVRRVNKLWSEKASSMDSQIKPPDVAIVIPMDGFHLYRSELDAMENPEEAHARRGGKGSVYVPSFDHGVGDPVEDDIFVNLQFIDIDIDKAMQRVLKRHISTGKPPEIAKQRVENNDRLNAEHIMKSMKNADIIIKSVDF